MTTAAGILATTLIVAAVFWYPLRGCAHELRARWRR